MEEAQAKVNEHLVKAKQTLHEDKASVASLFERFVRAEKEAHQVMEANNTQLAELQSALAQAKRALLSRWTKVNEGGGISGSSATESESEMGASALEDAWIEECANSPACRELLSQPNESAMRKALPGLALRMRDDFNSVEDELEKKAKIIERDRRETIQDDSVAHKTKVPMRLRQELQDTAWRLMDGPDQIGPQISGLSWKPLGDAKPSKGIELTNQALAAALSRKTKFTQSEWDAFGVFGLRKDHFIQSSSTYFGPSVQDLSAAAALWTFKEDDARLSSAVRRMRLHADLTANSAEVESLQDRADRSRDAPDKAAVDVRRQLDEVRGRVEDIRDEIHSTVRDGIESDKKARELISLEEKLALTELPSSSIEALRDECRAWARTEVEQHLYAEVMRFLEGCLQRVAHLLGQGDVQRVLARRLEVEARLISQAVDEDVLQSNSWASDFQAREKSVECECLEEEERLKVRRSALEQDEESFRLARQEQEIRAHVVSVRDFETDEQQLAESIRAILSDACGELERDAPRWACAQLHCLHASGARVYAAGQRLFTVKNGKRCDVTVVMTSEDEPVAASPLNDCSRLSVQSQRVKADGKESVVELVLAPFNHAPSVLPASVFDLLLGRYSRVLQAQHAGIVDALSGRRLNVFDQCVPIQVVRGDGESDANAGDPLQGVKEVDSLAAWFTHTQAERVQSSEEESAAHAQVLRSRLVVLSEMRLSFAGHDAVAAVNKLCTTSMQVHDALKELHDGTWAEVRAHAQEAIVDTLKRHNLAIRSACDRIILAGFMSEAAEMDHAEAHNKLRDDYLQMTKGLREALTMMETLKEDVAEARSQNEEAIRRVEVAEAKRIEAEEAEERNSTAHEAKEAERVRDASANELDKRIQILDAHTRQVLRLRKEATSSELAQRFHARKEAVKDLEAVTERSWEDYLDGTDLKGLEQQLNPVSCVLLTAGPAMGKTCLMSQLVMHTLRAGALVPILIKIQHLQRRLLLDREPLDQLYRQQEEEMAALQAKRESELLLHERALTEHKRALAEARKALAEEMVAPRATDEAKRESELAAARAAAAEKALTELAEARKALEEQHRRQRDSELRKSTFAQSSNWVDAFLQLTYGADSEVYRMLQQAMMARQALLLIDGIDEGGKVRADIERHITQVLAPQGHLMMVTSRPAGLNLDLWRRHGFHHAGLKPLSDTLQEKVVRQRLASMGERACDDLIEYVRLRAPKDNETDFRVTGNPLMLSMIISIYETRQGKQSTGPALERDGATTTVEAMPDTMAELYATASSAMLERVDRKDRGGAASVAAVPHLTDLLAAIFFQAHVKQRRVIEDEHLDAAALEVGAPIKHRELYFPLGTEGKQACVGDFVWVIRGEYMGKKGVVVEVYGQPTSCRQSKRDIAPLDDQSRPCRVQITTGETSGWIEQHSLLTSCLGQEEFEAKYSPAVVRERARAACERLPHGIRSALRAVRERVAQDRLPLLSLLQADPLQMQSSHLSFQEFFTARKLCAGSRLMGTQLPWCWSVWWANTLRLGIEMGDEFRFGLLYASTGERGIASELNLDQKIAGHRPTSVGATAELLRVVEHMSLARNALTVAEVRVLARALASTSRLTALNMSGNALGSAGVEAFASVLKTQSSLLRLDISRNMLCHPNLQGLGKLCDALCNGTALQELDLSENGLCDPSNKYRGYTPLCRLLKAPKCSLTELNLSKNKLDLNATSALRGANCVAKREVQVRLVY